MGKVTNSKDLIMLLLYAKGHTGKQCEPIRGRTRLMKMVFLFGKEVRREFNLNKVIPETVMPDFTDYDFGPFSAQVYSDVEFLVDCGFVRADSVNEPPIEEECLEYEYWQMTSGSDDPDTGPDSEEEFSLTKLGQGFVADELARELSQQQWNTLDDFKSRCTGTSLRALLRYVYSKYPEMTRKSKIKDDILQDYRF